MSRVLVTGTDPVSRALVAALRVEPWVERVITVDDDLSRPRTLRSVMQGPIRAQAIDTIVHAAPPGSPTHPGRRAHVVDVEATRELLRLAEEHATVRRLIYRSSSAVYHTGADAVEVIDEDHPLELSPAAPQWVRDRVEADLALCAHAGLSRLAIVVLRCAEIFAPGAGSQLHDWVQSRVCMRPLGYDPMVELLSVEDAVRALVAAAGASTQGVFNIPGADILPLSRLIAACRRLDVPVPGPLLHPAYRLRTLMIGKEFRYDMNAGRFHFGAVLDGRRARATLGYAPGHRIWFDGVRDARSRVTGREPRPS